MELSPLEVELLSRLSFFGGSRREFRGDGEHERVVNVVVFPSLKRSWMPPVHLILSRDSIGDLAKAVVHIHRCEWDGCQIVLNSWSQLLKHLHLHCTRAKKIDSGHYRCLLPKCSGQFHARRKELKKHILLSHLNRAWLPCPIAECEELQRLPQLLAHFDAQHDDLRGRVVDTPAPILKPTWEPTAPRSLPALTPLPRLLPVHQVLQQPIRMSWRSKRPPGTPPRRPSPHVSWSPLSPRRKMLDPMDEDDSGDPKLSTEFEDLEPFDPRKMTEWSEYIVRQKPPAVESQMSKPPNVKPRPGSDDADAPPSILWDTWSKKLDKLMESGMLPVRKSS